MNNMPSEYEKKIDEIREGMKHPETLLKDKIIEAAQILEKNNYPLDKICAKICKDCKGEPSASHIRKVLDEKYKEIENRNKPLVMDNEGNTLSEETGFERATVARSPDDEDYDNDDNEDDTENVTPRRKQSYAELSAAYEANKYRSIMSKHSLDKGVRNKSYDATKKTAVSPWAKEDKEDYQEQNKVLKSELNEMVNRLKTAQIKLREKDTIIIEKDKIIEELREQITHLQTQLKDQELR